VTRSSDRSHGYAYGRPQTSLTDLGVVPRELGSCRPPATPTSASSPSLRPGSTPTTHVATVRDNLAEGAAAMHERPYQPIAGQ
jgi:hypothetical protein